MDNINKYVGQNLKSIRKQFNLSLDELSEKSGLSKSMLSSIENGAKSPTISSLWKICDNLHIPLSRLTHISKPKVVVATNDQQNILQTNEELLFTSLFEFDSEKKFEIHRQELAPGYCHESNGHTNQVTEYVFVGEGTLTMNVNQTIYTLNQGEAIQFLATVPHSYANHADGILKTFTLLYYED